MYWRRTVQRGGLMRHVELRLGQSGTVFDKTDGLPAAPTVCGLAKSCPAIAKQAHGTLKGAAVAVTTLVWDQIAGVRAIEDLPDVVRTRLSVQLSTQTWAFVALVTAHADFKVPMAWQCHSPIDG